MKCKVTLPESHGLDEVRLWRLGLFVRGETRECDIDLCQLQSLKAHGFKVVKVKPPLTEADADPAGKE